MRIPCAMWNMCIGAHARASVARFVSISLTPLLVASCDLNIEPELPIQKSRSRQLVQELARDLPPSVAAAIHWLPTRSRQCVERSPPVDLSHCINLIVLGLTEAEAEQRQEVVATAIASLKPSVDSTLHGVFVSVTALVRRSGECDDQLTPRKVRDCFSSHRSTLVQLGR